MLTPTIHPSERNLTAIFALVLLIAAFVGFSGISSTPIGRHEAFVLQTAQEMNQRADYVVPYLFGKPRLKKPPLAYWLAVAVQKASGSVRVEAWHARLISVLAGLAMVIATLIAATRLFGRETGVLAAAMLAFSFGFIRQAHKASPDMLYASLCALGIAAFVHAYYRQNQGQSAWLATYGMWLSFALAILAKGPQVPAMFLLAFIIFLWREAKNIPDMGRLLRPLSGGLLALAVCAPWWLLLSHRIGSGTLHHSQLGGSLLHLSPLAILKLFYAYTTPLALLPWALLIPSAIMLAWRTPQKENPGLSLFGLIALVCLILFSIGSQQKDHYVVPVLPALCILLAAYTHTRLRPDNALSSPAGSLNAWMTAHLLLVLATLAIAPLISPDIWGARAVHWLICLALSTLLSAAAIYLLRYRGTLYQVRALVLAGGVFALLMSVVVQSRLYVGERAFSERALSEFVMDQHLDSLPMAGFRIAPVMLGYYVNRPIKTLGNVEKLQAFIGQIGPEGALLVLRSNNMKSLPADASVKILDRAGTGQKDLLLLIVKPAKA